MEKPTINLDNEEYYAHLMEVILKDEVEQYMQWFKEEGFNEFNKWKNNNLKN